MSNTRQLALAFFAGAAVAFSAVSFTAEPADSFQRPTALIGEAEIDDGGFAIYTNGVNTPVGFVWSRSVNGQQVETWALFRCDETDGWAFPGSNNKSVSITIDYENAGDFASTGAFLTWCENQFPASMNVDKAEDFEVHEHAVSVL